MAHTSKDIIHHNKIYIDAFFITNCVARCNKMVLESKATITGDSKGRRLRIYIPSEIALDSAFPFKKGDIVIIKIDKGKRRLVIEKYEGKNSRK